MITICGIAGYSCSLERTETFGKKRTVRIMRDAIESNLHRGSDAGGWAAASEDDVKVFKHGGHPMFILNQQLVPNFNPNALAVHTRASTLGDPKDNKNNHPVWWDGVWTTHNGHIANHQSIKNVLGAGCDPDIIPEVDSAAISMIVRAAMPTPADGITDDLVDTFDNEVTGGNAFASMWKDHPGYVLLARGSLSPLYVALCDDIVVWGSEQKAVAHITRRFGKINDWNHGLLHEGSFLLLKHGKVVDYKAYKKKSAQNKATRERIFVNYPGAIAYDNGGWASWSDEPGPLSSTEEDAGKLFLLDKSDIENSLASGLQSIAGDVDEIFMWIHPKNLTADGKKADYKDSKNRFFLLFGDIEVVSTFNGTIRDIYNHKGSAFFDRATRWRDVKHEEPEEAITSTAKERLLENAFQVRRGGDIPLVHPIVGVQRHKKENGSHTRQTEARGSAGWTRMPSLPVEHADITHKELVRSHYNPNFVFMSDRACIEHNLWYSLHKKPEHCDEAIGEAVDTLLSFEQLSDLMVVYPTSIEYSNWNVEHVHEWYTMGWSVADWDWEEDFTYWSFPSEDGCSYPGCNTKRRLPRDFYWATGVKEEKNTVSS